MVAFLAVFYVAWTLRVVLLMPVDRWIGDPWAGQAWSQGLRMTLWVLPIFVYVRRVDHTGVLHFLKLDVVPHGRRLAASGAIMAGFMGLSAAAAFLFQGASTAKLAATGGDDWAQLLVGMGCVSVAEETLFRGFVFQKLRERHSFHRANLTASALFLLIHVPGWLYMQGAHWGLVQLSVSIFLIGWILGWLFERAQSLWPPMLLHLLNNILSCVVLP